MRHRPVPFARLGLVDDDDVGQLRQREQVVRFRACGRRVDHDDGAGLAGDPGGRDGGGDRDLQLHEHDVAVGEHGPNVGVVHAQVRVGARRDHDGVLGRRVDDDRGRAARPRQRRPRRPARRRWRAGGRAVAQRRSRFRARRRAAPSAPARAAATAWLPPFPPGADASEEASTVWPGRGRASTVNVRSALTLPTTQIRAAMAATLTHPGPADTRRAQRRGPIRWGNESASTVGA